VLWLLWLVRIQQRECSLKRIPTQNSGVTDPVGDAPSHAWFSAALVVSRAPCLAVAFSPFTSLRALPSLLPHSYHLCALAKPARTCPDVVCCRPRHHSR